VAWQSTGWEPAADSAQDTGSLAGAWPAPSTVSTGLLLPVSGDSLARAPSPPRHLTWRVAGHLRSAADLTHDFAMALDAPLSSVIADYIARI
jgi:hypothetical protein